MLIRKHTLSTPYSVCWSTDRSLRGTPGDSRTVAGLRRGRLRPARLRESQKTADGHYYR